MATRVFISNRRSDGDVKARALARDLGARFGEAQLVLHGDGPGPGEAWADGLAARPGHAPVVLLLMTPEYLGGLDARGEPWIDARHDPVRIELESAIAAGARLLPVLCDGVIGLPDPVRLPAPFDTLSRLPWARLSEAEWTDDVARLGDQLVTLGLGSACDPPPGSGRASSDGPTTTPMPLDAFEPPAPTAPYGTVEGRRNFFGIAAAAALVLGGWGVLRWRERRAADLSGAWRTQIGARGAGSSRGGEPVLLTLSQKGTRLLLSSNTVDIGRSAEWESRRDAWRVRTGSELTGVTYRGEGRIIGANEADDDDATNSPASGSTMSTSAASGARRADADRRHGPANARRVLIDMRIAGTGGAGEALDTGVFRGVVDDYDQHIHGRLWLQSEQAERIVDLRRGGG